MFVHCYAGISRSSTIVIYYLSRLFDVEPVPTALRFLRWAGTGGTGGSNLTCSLTDNDDPKWSQTMDLLDSF